MSAEREVAVADTLQPDDPVMPRPPAGGPPIRDWNRYNVLELLGSGGMGSVYKARDPRLNRTVAIKFLIGADPKLIVRFLHEARAQARIEHPNVCRVHEVGEVEGRAYIALQFVDGEPLGTAAARMSLDEKVAVMRDVAAAIQEAHRLGIVHRDVKPGNILVEHHDDGRWFPIVMDFGLARETTLEGGITESGALLGTPAYMSPEQARGDVHAVDRRSDVYSLGATLYELLTGRPPFADGALALMLAHVIHDDPPPPRSLVASVPIDLETIALKCLAKDPAQRYGSARALADDLERYLSGEPILGRRLSRWQRMRMRARRHRALVTLGAWSLAIILAVGAFGVRMWIVSRTRGEQSAELAERLGREATEIESHLREAYQWPLHDTRTDRQLIRARMDAIAAMQHGLGELGDSIVHAALGRGHLALHEWREADGELGRVAVERRTPGVHLARGRVLGELYHRALEDARRSVEPRKAGDPAWLVGRQKQLEQQYLTPALAELDQGRSASEGTDLLEALIAFYRRDLATAEQRALAVIERQPGSSEARKLAADAAYAAAVEAFDRGQVEQVRAALERATRWYAEASEIARSDASLYESGAQAWLQYAELDDNQGGVPRAALERALDLVERAQRADPESSSAYTTNAYVLLRWYNVTALREADERPRFARIEQAATRAVELDPHSASAWKALGIAQYRHGAYELYHDGDGVPLLQRALDALGKALASQPDDPQINVEIGIAHRWLADHLHEIGADPAQELAAALASYRRATALDPRNVRGWSAEAELHTMSAEYDAALQRDPGAAAGRALSAGEHALALDPRHHYTLGCMARAQLAVAGYLGEGAHDPTSALTSARGYLDRAEQLVGGTLEIWYFRLCAANTQARFELQRPGGDPTAAIAVGRAAQAEAIRVFAGADLSFVEAARLGLLEAEWAARRGRDPAGLLARARADADRAIAINSKRVDSHVMAAEVCLRIARTHPSRPIVKAGFAYVDAALALNPAHSGAQELRTKLRALDSP